MKTQRSSDLLRELEARVLLSGNELLDGACAGLAADPSIVLRVEVSPSDTGRGSAFHSDQNPNTRDHGAAAVAPTAGVGEISDGLEEQDFFASSEALEDAVPQEASEAQTDIQYEAAQALDGEAVSGIEVERESGLRSAEGEAQAEVEEMGNGTEDRPCKAKRVWSTRPTEVCVFQTPRRRRTP